MSDTFGSASKTASCGITFARPEKKNAITNAMYAAMGEALARAESDPAVRVVLFEAEGDAFTAGNDLGDFAAVAAGTMARERNEGACVPDALARGQKPYVAAVQGLAVGVGVTMLLHCDLVFVADDAKLTTPFVNLALVPEAASSWLIPARIGHARAYAMFALGEPVDGRTAAASALRMPPLPASRSAREGAGRRQDARDATAGALQATKKLMRDAARIAAVMSARSRNLRRSDCKTAEAAEAFRAFAERRAPDFSQDLRLRGPRSKI